MGRLPPLASLQTVSCRDFLLRGRPLARWGPLHPLWGRGLYWHRRYCGRGISRLLAAFQHPEHPFRLGLDIHHTSNIVSRKRERYSRGDSSVACSKRSRSRMVFCCFRTPAYCLRKSPQKSSNPFMDFSGSCLNHNRAGPTRVIEKTLQVIASSRVSKAIICWKWYIWSRGSVFPSNGLKVGVVKSLGLGSIWIQSVKAFALPDHRGSGYDGCRVSYPTLPSSLASNRGAYPQGFHGVFHLSPPWFGKVSTGFAVPPAFVTRTGREPLPAVGFQTLIVLLRRNIPSAGSYLHLPASPRGEHYLCVPLRPHPLDPGRPRGPSLLFCLLPPGRQASDPASAPDLVVPLGSFLRHQDVCSWLSFSRVPSDVLKTLIS
ncbi:hypothetical protein PanWU01x14_181600 [Parasponia andersonii]|uniref:Uncharacterized protein n=1 Tax=Parasponia andersonii TaxID=3476 RepID=A0A2P5C5M0_PARAD|nr:hypothetical protein PanWU01x14_181600 [Parasponia andersonii]